MVYILTHINKTPSCR